MGSAVGGPSGGMSKTVEQLRVALSSVDALNGFCGGENVAVAGPSAEGGLEVKRHTGRYLICCFQVQMAISSLFRPVVVFSSQGGGGDGELRLAVPIYSILLRRKFSHCPSP